MKIEQNNHKSSEFSDPPGPGFSVLAGFFYCFWSDLALSHFFGRTDTMFEPNNHLFGVAWWVNMEVTFSGLSDLIRYRIHNEVISTVLVKPPGPSLDSDHYFHLWCPYIRTLRK